MSNPVFIYDNVATLNDIGALVMNYESLQNAFIHSLVNVIGRNFVWRRMFDDPWSIFDKGMLDFGDTVEETFIDIAKVHSYDPSTAYSTWMQREMPKILTAFHKLNYQKYVKNTIQRDDLRQAFRSWGEIDNLVSAVIESMYRTAYYARYCAKKYMICREILNGYVKPVYTAVIDSKDDADAALITCRQLALDNRVMTKGYNAAAVRNYIAPEDLCILITNSAQSWIDVLSLAAAFNMDKADFIGRIVPVDSFATHDTEMLKDIFNGASDYAPFTSDELTLLGTVQAVILDRNFMQVYNYDFDMNERFNDQGRYWNYWLHDWMVLSVSPFANAAMLTSTSSTISAIAVTPETANMLPGTSMTLSATVTASGFVDKSVEWTATVSGVAVPGVTMNGPVLSVAGTVTVGTEIVVTAKCVNKPSVTDTATITIISGESADAGGGGQS